MRSIYVIFENSKHNYITSVSENSTNQGLKKYFVNQFFNVGIFPSELIQKCIAIKFMK